MRLPRSEIPLMSECGLDGAREAQEANIFKSKNIKLLGGLSYKNTWTWIKWADISLAFSVRKEQTMSSGKVYEYLIHGCPVVMDEFVPEVFLQNEIDCIQTIFGFENVNGFVEKIGEALSKKWDRDKIEKYFKENHTWNIRAQQIHEGICHLK